MDEEKEKMKTGKKLVIALIMILLILTAGAYGYGVHYFTDHFLPGSQVNGFNCSYKTADETEKLLAKEVQAYVLTVDTRNNGKESITAKRSRPGLQAGWRSQKADQETGPVQMVPCF